MTKAILLNPAVLLVAPALAPAATHLLSDGYVPNEIVIKLRDTVAGTLEKSAAGGELSASASELTLPRDLDELNARYRVRDIKPLLNPPEADCQTDQRLRALQSESTTHLTPDDHFHSSQWSLRTIDAPEAWDITTGSSQIMVVVGDTGGDYKHRDLLPNMWVNETELNGIEGKDDDENGYIDDIYGYNFIRG